MDGEEEQLLVKRLRHGDQAAFTSLVRQHHMPMVLLARTYVTNDAVAEEVAQDAWAAMLKGIDGFEERSSVATWLFRILVNRAKSAGVRERRTIPVAHDEPAVEANRFDSSGCWSDPPAPWTDLIDDRVTATALAPVMRRAIEALPEAQRQVVILQDVEGLEAEAVCEILSLSDGHRRVLLHRGRSRARQAIEDKLGRSS